MATDGRETLQLAKPSLPPLDELTASLEAVWERAHLSNFGPVTRELEDLCREHTGLEHVASAANADLGLVLAVAALRLPPGTRAVLPSFTFPSTLQAARWNGLEPVFADVDPGTWCATAESMEPALEGAGLILATHCFLGTADAAGLEAAAAAAGVPLVFDAAQAFATWVGDRHVGSFGDASVFSFGATKVVTSGEGGLAAFRDPEAAERFRRLRTHGLTRDYEVVEPGLNAKLSELHAALGCLTIPRVEDRVAELSALVGAYRERLDGAPGVRLQVVPDGVRPTPTHVVVDVGEERDALARALAAEGIETRTYFRPLHEMPAFAGVAAAPLPVTERLGRSLLTLPLHTGMDAGDVGRVCDVLLAAR